MRSLMVIITVLSIPIMYLSMLGGIVSGIWLAILGEWGTIVLGILFFFVSTWALGLVLMPSIPLDVRAAYCAEKGKTFGMLFFGTLSNLYIIAVITIWCCGVLYLFVKDATTSSLIPSLIWSYGVATGPWAYMASKDQQRGESEGFASALATFFAELAYVVIMIMIFFTPITLIQAIKIFAGFMLVGLVIQMIMAFLIQKEMKEFADQSDTLYD